MPVLLTRRHPFTRPATSSTLVPKSKDPSQVFAESNGTVAAQARARQGLKLRRMPRVGSDVTGVHFRPDPDQENKDNITPPTRLNYYLRAQQRATVNSAARTSMLLKPVALLAVPPPPQRRPNPGMPLAPLKNTLSAVAMAKERLVKTREAYKEKLTLVKNRLKTRRRRFKRSHLHYTPAKDSPNTVKAMRAMAMPPPRQPLYFESDNEDDTDADEGENDKVSKFCEMPQDKSKHSRSNIQLSTSSLDESNELSRFSVLRRATTAPSSLSRRRGITPPPLDAGSYPFGKHSNDIAKRP